ncbi:glycerate kinase [Planococcus maritimus]|uniref:glycerate kinase n=1 Tax=Planococcus maritimus TaxID=192421 RepID=UPI00232E0950|nr:glycerate kinase [Planococcus maritimus]
MKIMIAPDSFKGSISSTQAAQAIDRAVREVDPAIETVLLPMADGGEGTVDAILWNRGGKKISCSAEDPIGRNIEAYYGWIAEEKMAIIETASASGLPLLKKEELDPDKASSFGTGQLIVDALERGAETIVLGLGGSATVDAGIGLFQALGLKFFDVQHKELPRIGGQLSRVESLDASALHPKLSSLKLIVASDVTNPLLGENGAAAIFGPQKGVSDSQLATVEQGMERFSRLVVEATGEDHIQKPGSGAAGGIGFMLYSFLHAEFRNGLEMIAEISQLEKRLLECDLVLTGEGKIDGQSLYGKVPVGIGRAALKNNIPVIAFAGAVGEGIERLEEEGVTAVMVIGERPMPLEEAMLRGEELLYESAKRLMKLLSIGIKYGGEAKNE